MAAVAEINGLGVNIMGCYEYCFDVQMGTSLKWSTLAGMCAAGRRSARTHARTPRKSILSLRCLAYEGGVCQSVLTRCAREKMPSFCFISFFLNSQVNEDGDKRNLGKEMSTHLFVRWDANDFDH